MAAAAIHDDSAAGTNVSYDADAGQSSSDSQLKVYIILSSCIKIQLLNIVSLLFVLSTLLLAPQSNDAG